MLYVLEHALFFLGELEVLGMALRKVQVGVEGSIGPVLLEV